MDTNRIRELLDARDKLDQEIQEAVGATVKERKPPKCSICGSDQHTARNCPQKQQ